MRNNRERGEQVCIYAIDILLQEDTHFIFVAIDVATEFSFEPSIEKEDNIQNLLNFINHLMKDNNFSAHKGKPFTLVLARYHNDLPAIEKLVKPFGGSVIIDEDLVLETVTPFLEEFYGQKEPSDSTENSIDLPDEDFSLIELSFIEFLRLLPNQSANEVNEFLQIAVTDKSFVFTSDPVILSKYLYLKLNLDQTLIFQKLFLIYASLVQKNTIPNKYLRNPKEMLRGLNQILDLQNKDKEYPFSHELR